MKINLNVVDQKVSTGFQILSSDQNFKTNSQTFASENGRLNRLFCSYTFRKSTHFESIPNPYLFPINTPTLRLHNLLVFDGNTMMSQLSGADDKFVEISRFSEPNVLIYNSTISTPYIWLGLDSAITDLELKRILDNLLFKPSEIIGLKNSEINCSHKISGVCVRCNPGVPSLGDCITCTAFEMYIPALNKCVTKNASPPMLDTSNIKKYASAIDDNFYGFSTTPLDINVQNWSFFDSNESGSVQFGDLLDSNMLGLELNDDMLHIFEIDLKFVSPADVISMNDKGILLLLNDDSTNNLFLRFLYDRIIFEQLALSFYTQIFIFAADNLVTNKYRSLNFLWNTDMTNDLSLEIASSSIKTYTLNPSSLMTNLETVLLPFNGVKHFVGFPVNYLTTGKLYYSDSLYEYKSIGADTLDNTSFIFHYIEDLGHFKHVKKCPQNCDLCLDQFECTVCDPSFTLIWGNCVACSSECQACIDHPRKCMACADTPDDQITSKIISICFVCSPKLIFF